MFLLGPYRTHGHIFKLFLPFQISTPHGYECEGQGLACTVPLAPPSLPCPSHSAIFQTMAAGHEQDACSQNSDMAFKGHLGQPLSRPACSPLLRRLPWPLTHPGVPAYSLLPAQTSSDNSSTSVPGSLVSDPLPAKQPPTSGALLWVQRAGESLVQRRFWAQGRTLDMLGAAAFSIESQSVEN